MTQIMTPSKTTTDGQIDKAVSNYRALLEKHAKEFGAEAVQVVLGQSEFADAQFAVFRRHVEVISNLIIVSAVVVDCGRSPQQALEVTGRVQYTDRKVVENMPKAPAVLAEIVFFKPDLSKRNGCISDDDLEKEYALRGLEPVDPISLTALNEVTPAFADETPHGTHWKDAYGNWCFAAFDHRYGKRYVYVDCNDNDWDGDWWFAGVRKRSQVVLNTKYL
jgi:hypothetical protein